jgi:hypothetical protein
VGPKAKLFHCVVVMGAAVGAGCGGRQTATEGADGSAASPDAAEVAEGGGAVSLTSVDACAGPFLAGYGCSSTCRGTPDAPTSPLDCAHAQDLECDAGTCQCDPAAPLAATDCPATGQFTCDEWSPLCGCRCNDAAVLDPAACCGDAGIEAGSGCYNLNGGLEWSCQSYDPPVGCDCRRIVIGIL